jgi:predicted  nucleic acid-binding Zn-ribbon protein
MAKKILLFCPECGCRLYMSIRAEITGDAEITHLLPTENVPTPDPCGYRTFVYDPKSVRLWCGSCDQSFEVDEAVGRPREESA